MTAITGAAISIASGTATAAMRMRRVSIARSVTWGDDSNSTGNNVHAGIDHSDVISVPLTTAPSIGNRNGPQNAAAANRRFGSLGQILSASMARLGHDATRTMISGMAI